MAGWLASSRRLSSRRGPDDNAPVQPPIQTSVDPGRLETHLSQHPKAEKAPPLWPVVRYRRGTNAVGYQSCHDPERHNRLAKRVNRFQDRDPAGYVTIGRLVDEAVKVAGRMATRTLLPPPAARSRTTCESGRPPPRVTPPRTGRSGPSLGSTERGARHLDDTLAAYGRIRVHDSCGGV